MLLMDATYQGRGRPKHRPTYTYQWKFQSPNHCYMKNRKSIAIKYQSIEIVRCSILHRKPPSTLCVDDINQIVSNDAVDIVRNIRYRPAAIFVSKSVVDPTLRWRPLGDRIGPFVWSVSAAGEMSWPLNGDFVLDFCYPEATVCFFCL